MPPKRMAIIAEILPGNRVVCRLTNYNLPLFGADTVWVVYNNSIVCFVFRSALENEIGALGIKNMPRIYSDRKFDVVDFALSLGDEVEKFIPWLEKRIGINFGISKALARVSA